MDARRTPRGAQWDPRRPPGGADGPLPRCAGPGGPRSHLLDHLTRVDVHVEVKLGRRHVDVEAQPVGGKGLPLLLEGAPRPAAILGFPVGFVGAAESKEALIDTAHGVPFLTLRGRRGGSALAAAAVNALAAPEEPAP